MQKAVQFFTKFEVIKPLNQDFTLCKCRVMALGKNRNYSHFSKESVDEALPTLANIPVVAHVYADSEGRLRLGGHDCELVSEDGTYKFKPTTIPWGVVPESHNAHYEEVVDDPYLIKDTYKRIQMSPWFVHATYGSLETALEKAKILVDMIGLENVKLVKIVPFDQFVEIQ